MHGGSNQTFGLVHVAVLRGVSDRKKGLFAGKPSEPLKDGRGAEGPASVSPSLSLSERLILDIEAKATLFGGVGHAESNSPLRAEGLLHRKPLRPVREDSAKSEADLLDEVDCLEPTLLKS
mmetsp:Transcript_68428/g.121989  ORF Transcript_68428/g.121989 Transcript_68428/m.121989 type:complete len:121 (+) Transcript_68428:89-451(+)